MIGFPVKFETEDELDEYISRPGNEVIDLMSRIRGDIMFLGIAGKIGPSLALMAKRACEAAGVGKKIFGVSRFSSGETRQMLESKGIETISGDLMDIGFLKSLPETENLFFLAGMKFGSEDNLALTWAINSHLPGLVAEKYKYAKIVAYSTGCVYPIVEIESGGSRETDKPEPVGEYAQSCLGRERMFEYGSQKYKTAVSIIRLNYSVELRYGVLVDIASKVYNDIPVDVTMGYFNVIWQGDANEMVLRSVENASAPAKIINITGEDILSVRETAVEFGKIFDKKPKFTGHEAETALLSDAHHSFELFGLPKVPVSQVIKWTADWIQDEKKTLNKPTHFEVRDGKY